MAANSARSSSSQLSVSCDASTLASSEVVSTASATGGDTSEACRRRELLPPGGWEEAAIAVARTSSERHALATHLQGGGTPL